MNMIYVMHNVHLYKCIMNCFSIVLVSHIVPNRQFIEISQFIMPTNNREIELITAESYLYLM